MIRLLIAFLLLSSTSFGQVIKANTNYRPFAAGGGPSCPFNITSWVSTTNWQESPTGIWGPISYPANGEGIASVGGLSGDVYIQAEYNNSLNESTAIFLTANESPASPFYADVEFGLYIASSGNYSTAIAGSYTDLSVAAVSGDLFRVIRTGTTVKAQYYRSATWTDLYTYTTGSSGSLFLGASSADPGEAKYLRNPKYCN